MEALRAPGKEEGEDGAAASFRHGMEGQGNLGGPSTHVDVRSEAACASERAKLLASRRKKPCSHMIKVRRLGASATRGATRVPLLRSTAAGTLSTQAVHARVHAVSVCANALIRERSLG